MAEAQWAAADYGSLILDTERGASRFPRHHVPRDQPQCPRKGADGRPNGPSANLLRSKAINADPWVIGLRRRRPSLG
jgi:hypothetical protein